MRRYKTIVIDPPWPGPGAVPAFDAVKTGQATLTKNLIPYATMTGIQCAALSVDAIAADDAQLFIWATSRSMGDAYLLLQLWAFKYRGLFVWQKPLGMGRHMRHECEFLLWGGRRGAKLVEPKNCPRQTHHWKRPRAHSEKPAEAYAMIRELSPGPRLDIFARQKRPGFTPWGNQAPSAAEQLEQLAAA